MLNDSIALYFKFAIVSGSFDIGLNGFPLHGTILIPLMDDDCILKRGGGKHIWKDAE